MKRNKSFDSENKGILYLVATPIGNLKEMSPRAIEVLSSVDIIAAEDTRNSLSLLQKFSIKKELFSLHEHNETEASQYIIKLLKENKKIAYVSDAGYPCISDPGNKLVKAAISEGFSISPISGSSAFISALVSSGMDTNHFYFYGFLPSKQTEAKKELETIKKKKETLIFYESPHRITETLHLFLEILGNRNATIAREISKINEEFVYGELSELSQIDSTSLKGEMVIVIEGNKNADSPQVSDKEIINRFEFLNSLEVSSKAAIEIVSSEYQINKNYVKKLLYKK